MTSSISPPGSTIRLTLRFTQPVARNAGRNREVESLRGELEKERHEEFLGYRERESKSREHLLSLTQKLTQVCLVRACAGLLCVYGVMCMRLRSFV